jgi:protein-S-isoprenylcysteine O-methyltransferase Ste14
MSDEQAYGLWPLVILSSFVFIIFAFSFAKPRSKRDWRSLGAFSAFIVALFTEMYGFPLTIYLLSGWLQTRFPGLDPFTHDSGHLWHTIFGLKGDPHFDILHIASFVFIIGGFWLLSAAWPVLHKAQQEHELATSGVYARIRHPQYLGFVLIMIGFLLQWPTILTLLMFPVLVFMYARLAATEEREMREQFGARYDAYAAVTPRFIPNVFGQTPSAPVHG